MFIDDGWSGTNFARPAFTEIMELAEKGLIGTLIVKDHSRLGRNRLIVGQLLDCLLYTSRRFSVRLTAPYSEDRRSKAKETMTAVNQQRQKDNFKKPL